MKKLIISFIAAVVVISPIQASFASAADSFFGADNTNQSFGAGAGYGQTTNGSFGAGSGYTSGDAFFGSGATNQPFGVSDTTPTDDCFFGHPCSTSRNDGVPFGTCTSNCGSFFDDSYNGQSFGTCDSNCDYGTPSDPCDYYSCAPIPSDPCASTWCYPQHDNSEYQSTNTNNNNNDNSNSNTNINQNEIWINIYGNGSVTGSDINVRSLPSCNNAIDDDNDGRVDYNDTDCRAYGSENGRNTQLNTTAPVFTTVAPTTARVGATYSYLAQARDNDGDVLTYALANSPAGMTIDRLTGLIRFTPLAAQGGQAYAVTVVASDGKYEATQNFQIFVEKAAVRAVAQNAGASASNGRVAGASIAVAEASDESALHAYNIRVDTDEDQNSIITWETTKPSRGQVIYGLATQGDRAGTDFTGAGQYEFATPVSADTSTSHRFVLGKLENERVYYFRVVSFVGTEKNVSTERSFVQLPSGETLNSNAGFASVIGTLGSFLISPWFLLLVIILITLMIIFRRRNQSEIIAHDLSGEAHGAAHH